MRDMPPGKLTIQGFATEQAELEEFRVSVEAMLDVEFPDRVRERERKNRRHLACWDRWLLFLAACKFWVR